MLGYFSGHSSSQQQFHSTSSHLQSFPVTQRASVPGTLIVSEATSISPQAGGHANAPAMRISLDGKPFVQPHVLQCFGTNDRLGRAANAAILKQERGFDVVAPKPHSNPWR
jgi:hypothetical protein